MSTLAVNSIIPANAGSEDYFLARSWVNFNGIGTVAIRADGNVSSITDNGLGYFTMNFSTSLSSANYAQIGSGDALGTDTSTLRGYETVKDFKLTSSMRGAWQNGINTDRYDPEQASVLAML